MDCTQPLPEFDRPSAQAYACHDRTTPARPLLALLTTTELPLRAVAARAFARRRPAGLLVLHHFGPYRPDDQRPACMALVYDRPPAGAVPLVAQATMPRAREIETWRRLLLRVAPTLRTLAGIKIAHRAIRPGNLWSVGGHEGDILFGDGVAAPAGFDQPAAYEPIERAMAARTGRGEGTAADDVFALGVTALALAAGEEPGRDRSDDEVLAARLEKGSYAALTEGLRIPVPLVEPLRGMLADDPADRWTPRDLQTWVDGGRPRTRSIRPRATPETPFLFAGKLHQDLRSLATSLTCEVPEATRALRGGGLASWARYALHDAALTKRLGDLAVGTGARGTPGSADDALVARAALLLDPNAPIRYRGTAFTVDGFGPALAEAILAGGNGQALAEALLLDLPAFRKRARRDEPEPGPPESTHLIQYLRDPRPGYGVERCLYETNAGLPCLSPAVREAGVIRLRDLLPALERAAESETRATLPMDRHVAAFVVAHEGREAEALLPGLADRTPAAGAEAMLALLALLQRRYPQEPVPHLATWIGRSLTPIAASLRRKATREAMERELRRELPSGDLPRLYALVTDPERRRKDREGFAAASTYWNQAEREIERVHSTDSQRRRRSLERGGHIAAMIAMAAAVVSACLTLLGLIR